MIDEVYLAKIDELLMNISERQMPELLHIAGALVTSPLPDDENRKQIRREFASASIAAHYIEPYAAELTRRDIERRKLNQEVRRLDHILASLPDGHPDREEHWNQKVRTVSQIELQFHMMAIASSMVRRLLPRMIFPTRRNLDSRALDTLKAFEELRDNFEHFDQRLPGRDKQDWMVRESGSGEDWKIILGLPRNERGLVVLNEVEMEFSTRQVQRMQDALNTLQAQVRRETLRYIRKSLRRTPYDFPVDPVLPPRIRHELAVIED